MFGYFGSGADANHTNKGYQLLPPYAQGDFATRHFPGSAQTQVVGISDTGIAVAFSVTPNGANSGFWRARGRHRAGEFRTLGEEAVPRMNRVGAGFQSGRNDEVAAQVGIRGGRAGQAYGGICLSGMRRVRVGVGEDGDRGQAPAAAVGEQPVGEFERDV